MIKKIHDYGHMINNVISLDLDGKGWKGIHYSVYSQYVHLIVPYSIHIGDI